ncbi:MAG: hypothetical protein K8T10_06260 [Candidatus Eremiobacteraeota bacterium]|nr:hypothetical protein [Candidatus Eremiobacteraeota bacterium]
MNTKKNTGRIAFLLILVFLLTAQILAGDKKKPADNPGDKTQETKIRMFEFSSGGRYHPSGYGEWIVKLESDGEMSVSHKMRGRKKNYKSFKLTEEENEKIWKTVDSINVKKLKSSTRPGVPDEVKYTFTLSDGDRKYKKSIWINDAREKNDVMTLVDSLAGLIKKHLKRKPVMK